ncbi:hypothetical protein VTN00DRAFT_1038 [Thermoascus crustaceus]
MAKFVLQHSGCLAIVRDHDPLPLRTWMLDEKRS